MNRRKMPHLVAEEGGAVVGYAYAVPFRKRPAYSLHGQAFDLCAQRPAARRESDAS